MQKSTPVPYLLFLALHSTFSDLLFRASRDIVATLEHTVFCQEAISDHVEKKDFEPTERLEGTIS